MTPPPSTTSVPYSAAAIPTEPKAAESFVDANSKTHVRNKSADKGAGFVFLVALGDIAIAAFALCAGWWLRFETPLSQIGTPEPVAGLTLQDYAGHILVGTTILFIAMFQSGAYNYRQLLTAARKGRLVLRATFVWLVAFLGLSLFLKFQPQISRIYCALAAAGLVIGLSYWRLIVANYLVPIAGSLRRKVLVLGWNAETQRIFKGLERASVPEFEIAGALESADSEPSVAFPHETPVFGDYSKLENVLETNPIDAVLVADPAFDQQQLNQIASLCEREMVDFELIPSCFPSLISGLSLKQVYGSPVLGVTRLPLYSSLNQFIKRFVDIVGALVGLILSAPIILLLGFLIMIESRGPIFYRQVRQGKNGRLFKMLKLRSMRLDAEANSKPGWTVKNDPRCLRIGKFMRKLNLDELPQFWNVLKGQMSLVGPRPERPELIQDFKGSILNYNARHNVKPGLTGWAQVNGLRGDTDLGERIQHDLYYIENWSLLFDINIMIRTLISRKGAC